MYIDANIIRHARTAAARCHVCACTCTETKIDELKDTLGFSGRHKLPPANRRRPKLPIRCWNRLDRQLVRHKREPRNNQQGDVNLFAAALRTDRIKRVYVEHEQICLKTGIRMQVFLSHLHSDHITDLAPLFAIASGRTSPLQVWGPSGASVATGTNATVAGLRAVCLSASRASLGLCFTMFPQIIVACGNVSFNARN